MFFRYGRSSHRTDASPSGLGFCEPVDKWVTLSLDTGQLLIRSPRMLIKERDQICVRVLYPGAMVNEHLANEGGKKIKKKKKIVPHADGGMAKVTPINTERGYLEWLSSGIALQSIPAAEVRPVPH